MSLLKPTRLAHNKQGSTCDRRTQRQERQRDGVREAVGIAMSPGSVGGSCEWTRWWWASVTQPISARQTSMALPEPRRPDTRARSERRVGRGAREGLVEAALPHSVACSPVSAPNMSGACSRRLAMSDQADPVVGRCAAGSAPCRVARSRPFSTGLLRPMCRLGSCTRQNTLRPGVPCRVLSSTTHSFLALHRLTTRARYGAGLEALRSPMAHSRTNVFSLSCFVFCDLWCLVRCFVWCHCFMLCGWCVQFPHSVRAFGLPMRLAP